MRYICLPCCIAGPAVLYTLSNSLAFVAAGTLSAPVLQVLYQTKLLLSAALAWFFLGRSLTPWQLCLLFLVACGVVAVHGAFGRGPHSETTPPELFGIVAAVLSAMASAAAGVVSEALLKPIPALTPGGGSKPKARPGAVWLFNAQMAIICAIIACLRIGVAAYTGALQHTRGVGPHTWPWLAWLHLLVASAGGLLAGLAVQVAGSVPKMVASSCSMVLTAAFSVVVLGTPLRWWGWVGLLATPVACTAFLSSYTHDNSTQLDGGTSGSRTRARQRLGVGPGSPLALASPTALATRAGANRRRGRAP